MAADATMAAGTNGSACTVNNVDGIKCGTSKAAGDMTITVGAGATKLTLYAAAWNNVTGLSLNIAAPEGVTATPASIDLTMDAGISNNPPFTLSGNVADFKHEIVLEGVSAATTLTITSSAAKRFVVWGATYDTGEVTPPEPTCDWDNIAYAGNGSGNADYTDRFKVCLGDPAPNFVNLQAPGWATEAGFYFEFPSAAWGAISLEEGEYQIQGAGILLFASAFLYDAEKEVTIVCQDVEYTITIKNNNPEVAPVTAITCAEVYQMAKNDVVDLLNDVVVTYANGKNVWVRDETASMLLYLSANTTWKAGDVLSGVAGVVDIYNGVTEIKPTAVQVAAVTATEGEAPAAIELAAVEAADVNKYIVMKNIAVNGTFAEGTASNITIANGEGTIVVRNNFKNGFAFDAEKTYDIYCVVTIYQSNPQLYFITAEEHVATAIDNTNVEAKAVKFFENGQLIILKNGVKYNAQGAIVK